MSYSRRKRKRKREEYRVERPKERVRFLGGKGHHKFGVSEIKGKGNGGKIKSESNGEWR